MRNTVNWFEIPAADLPRAMRFYGEIFQIEMHLMPEYEGTQSAFFPDGGGVGGCIAAGKGYTPSREGTIVFLNGGDDLSVVLDRVEAANGQIELPKTGIGENGFVAIFIDSEGNRVGLHSDR